MRQKSSLPILFSLTVALTASGWAAPQAPKYKVRWVLGHQNLDYFEEAARNFKAAVEKGSGGEISVEIAAGSYNDQGSGGVGDREVSAMVQDGRAEMGHSFLDVMDSVDPKLCAFEAPALFRGYRHVEGVIEGPVGEKLLADLRGKGLVGLSFTFSGGANGVATTERALRAPEDLRGLKIGVYPDAVAEAWLKSVGATPIPVDHSLRTVLPSAADGTMDAVLITWRNFARLRLDERFKYFNMAGVSYLGSVTYVNQKFFESLPAKYRTLLMEESRKAGRIERAKTIALNESSKREMLSKGVRPVAWGQAAQSRFVGQLKPAYEKLDALLGRALLDSIRATKDGDAPAVPSTLAGR